MNNSNVEHDMYKVKVDEAMAQCKANPIPNFDGITPISVDYAKQYFKERADFFLSRLGRSIKRPTPDLYDEKGNLSMDLERFQADLGGLLYAQKCRAAIETAMACDKEIEVAVPQSKTPTTFKKIDEKSLFIHAK